MNIKSLLLGSAAALAVVSGAQAADAVVAAEPEPMEYVKVCDAYGTGFFYIPGTETCLKIGGRVRHEKIVKKAGDADEDYINHSRIRFEVESRNDSDWGTVYSWIRIQGDQNDNASKYIPGQTDDLKWYYYFGIGGLDQFADAAHERVVVARGRGDATTVHDFEVVTAGDQLDLGAADVDAVPGLHGGLSRDGGWSRPGRRG